MALKLTGQAAALGQRERRVALLAQPFDARHLVGRRELLDRHRAGAGGATGAGSGARLAANLFMPAIRGQELVAVALLLDHAAADRARPAVLLALLRGHDDEVSRRWRPIEVEAADLFQPLAERRRAQGSGRIERTWLGSALLLVQS